MCFFFSPSPPFAKIFPFAISREAVRQQNVALLTLVDAVRYGPAIIVFAVGLLLLAIGAILVAIAVWRIRHIVTMEWYSVRSGICALHSTVFRIPTNQSG